MDTKTVAEVDRLIDPPKRIKARVRPDNRYSTHVEGKEHTVHLAGEIVEVTERELARCKNALISLDAESAEARAVKAAAPNQDNNVLFRGFRKANRASAAHMAESKAIRKRRELEDLGFKPAG